MTSAFFFFVMKRFAFPLLLLSPLGWLLAAPAYPAQLQLVSSTGLTLTALTNGDVHLFAADGTQLMLFDGYRFTLGSADVETGNASPALVTAGGRPALRMSYALTGGGTGTALTGLFIPEGNVVHLRFDLRVSSTPDNTILRVRSIPSGTIKANAHESFWVRHTGGGVPYETLALHGLKYTFPGGARAWLNLPSSYLPWQDVWSAHLPFAPAGSGQWRAEADWVLLPDPALRSPAAAALIAKRPLCLDVWTTQPYNLWNSSAAPLVLHTQTFNPAASPRSVTLSWWARDYTGTLVASGSDTRELGAAAIRDRSLSLPAPARGPLFVEVSATAGSDTVFRRTNLGVLPPHTFLGDDPLFGLANTFELPDRATEQTLIRRLGVRSLRYQKYPAPEAASIGVVQSHHSNNTAWITGPVPDAWIDAELIKARDGGAPFWQVSNEMNLTSGSAANYVSNFLRRARLRRDAISPGVGLTLGGLAGWDPSYLQALHAAGAWNHIDAFAFHPGRGNYTADYPGENGQILSPDRWNFLGAIRSYKNAIAPYGAKPLHISEAYSCTLPNNGWRDNQRDAADAVLLSFALARSEGIAVMHYYQLNDTVWNDVGGVDPTDAEYHFGLLNRDLSPKPALFGYATAAENLEGSVFERWMSFADSRQHGLWFSTPRGPLAILWDRRDGYVLDNNPSPEPWLDTWASTSPLTLPAAIEPGSGAGVVDTLFDEPFDHAGPEINVSAKPGWIVYIASTGTVTNAPKIQPGGVVFSSPPRANALVFARTGFGEIAFPEAGDLSIDTIASSNLGRVRLLVRLDNNQWYASNTEFTPVTASSWANAFAGGLEYRRRFPLTASARDWSHFSLTPGSPMGIGALLDGDLPSRIITGLGWHVADISSAYGLTARFDNLVVRGVSGGPAVRVLNALGQSAEVPAIDGVVTLTLDGSPRIVRGLAAYAGLDVVMDNAGPGTSQTGSWTVANNLALAHASTYAHDNNTGKGDKTFKFTPHLGVGGAYRVDLWWPAAANQATNTLVTVNHADGGTALHLDQRNDGGRWVSLGSYTFNKGFGGNVTLSNADTDGRVVADAVRFVALFDARDAFARWTTDTFSPVELADREISDPLAAPFGDAVPNLLRAAFNLGSGPADIAALPACELVGGHLTLRYRQRRGGQGAPGIDYTAGGLRYVVEVSDDLVTWRSGADQVAAVGSPTPIDAETESVTVRQLAPFSAGMRAFLRLRVVRVSP